MKAKVVVGALVAVIGFGLIMTAVLAQDAQQEESDPLEFLVVAIRDAHDKGVLPDSVSNLLSDWFIENLIAPNSNETPAQVRERLLVQLTPQPTATPAPTPSFPDRINAGTYRVGEDIAVGLYRGVVTQQGFRSSCTWERWRSNGALKYRAELDIHLSVGYQFYVRVIETDHELITNCSLTRVTDFTRPPASDLPNAIEPGQYLVGVEVRPGIYDGVVPSGDSCSWARRADFTGVYGEDIDLGFHSTDGFKFNVIIAPEDYGFSTNCDLTRVEQ